jgi:hypothetical protein
MRSRKKTSKTKPLTLADVEQLTREHGAGDAWDQLTPAQRRQWADRVRKQQERERQALEKARVDAAREAGI